MRSDLIHIKIPNLNGVSKLITSSFPLCSPRAFSLLAHVSADRKGVIAVEFGVIRHDLGGRDCCHHAGQRCFHPIASIGAVL
jgi:hypothetical protein